MAVTRVNDVMRSSGATSDGSWSVLRAARAGELVEGVSEGHPVG
jgi:hypothetical protein